MFPDVEFAKSENLGGSWQDGSCSVSCVDPRLLFDDPSPHAARLQCDGRKKPGLGVEGKPAENGAVSDSHVPPEYHRLTRLKNASR
jgi:hypothetical protein